MITTTTRKAPVSPTVFREATFALPATSDDQTTAETPVLLTTTVPEATSATTGFPEVTTPETIAPPTFAVTAAMVTTSALPHFSTKFQKVDVTTEYDCVFCSEESVTNRTKGNQHQSFLLFCVAEIVYVSLTLAS